MTYDLIIRLCFLLIDMFVGQLKSTLTCTKCDYKSPTYELYWMVTTSRLVPAAMRSDAAPNDTQLKSYPKFS